MNAGVKNLNSDTETADLNSKIDTLRNDLSILTQSIAEMSKTKGEDAVLAARLKMVDAGDTLNDQAETARLRAMLLQDQANDFVRTQPAAAIGIAAGIGFLVGFLGTRR